MESVTLTLLGSAALNAALFYYYDKIRPSESVIMNNIRIWTFYIFGYLFNMFLAAFAYTTAKDAVLSNSIILLCQTYFVFTWIQVFVMLFPTIKATFKGGKDAK